MNAINGVTAARSLTGQLTGRSANPGLESATVIAGESSKVTLSDDAKVLARFASKGLTVAMRQFDQPLTASASAPEAGPAVTAKSLSRQDFMALLSSLGVSEADSQKLLAGMDHDGDETLSHDEILQAFAGAANTDTPMSQAVLGLMDRQGNNDGSVNAREFAKLATAFYDAER